MFRLFKLNLRLVQQILNRFLAILETDKTKINFCPLLTVFISVNSVNRKYYNLFRECDKNDLIDLALKWNG